MALVRWVSIIVFLLGFLGGIFTVFSSKHSGTLVGTLGLRLQKDTPENILYTTDRVVLSRKNNPHRIWIQTSESGLGGLTDFTARVRLVGENGRIISDYKKSFNYRHDRQRSSLPWRRETKYEVGFVEVPAHGEFYVNVNIGRKVYHLFSSTNEEFKIRIDKDAEKPDMELILIFLPLIVLGGIGLVFTRDDNLRRFGLKR